MMSYFDSNFHEVEEAKSFDETHEGEESQFSQKELFFSDIF